MGESRILNDDELSNVTGGAKLTNVIKIKCPHCQKTFKADINKDEIKCTHCLKDIGAKG